jgi:hypothetical protein
MMPINVNTPTNDAIKVLVSSGTEMNQNNRILSDGHHKNGKLDCEWWLVNAFMSDAG